LSPTDRWHEAVGTYDFRFRRASIAHAAGCR
jgi:hypothetical protein